MASRPRHQIEILFPILLFFLFTAFSLTVLLLAANAYRSSVSQALRNDNARASLAYLTEKVHQNDRENGIYLGTFDEQTALVLSGEEGYLTYLYFHDGALKELFTTKDASVDAASGRVILPLTDLSMQISDGNLLTFQATDSDLHTAAITVAVRTPQQKEGSHDEVS